jgi:hypothetical protein
VVDARLALNLAFTSQYWQIPSNTNFLASIIAQAYLSFNGNYAQICAYIAAQIKVVTLVEVNVAIGVSLSTQTCQATWKNSNFICHGTWNNVDPILISACH